MRPRPAFAGGSAATAAESETILPAPIAPVRLLVSAVAAPAVVAGAADTTGAGSSRGKNEGTISSSEGSAGGDAAVTEPLSPGAATAQDTQAAAKSPTMAIAASVGAIAAVACAGAAVLAQQRRRRRLTTASKTKLNPPMGPSPPGLKPSKGLVKSLLPRFAPAARKPSFKPLGAAGRIARGSFGSIDSATAAQRASAASEDANVIAYISPDRAVGPLLGGNVMPALQAIGDAPQQPYALSELYSDLAGSYRSMSVNSVSTVPWRASDAPTVAGGSTIRYSSASSASTQRDYEQQRRTVHFRSGASIVGTAAGGSPALPTLAFPHALRMSILSDDTATDDDDGAWREMGGMAHADARVRELGAGHARSRSVRVDDAERDLPDAAATAQLQMPTLASDKEARYPSVLGHGWAMAF